MFFRVSENLFSGDLFGEQDWSLLERQFLVTQISSSVFALVAFPIWLLWSGTLTYEMAVSFVWLLGPLTAALVLVRSRSLELAFLVSATTLAGLIATICAFTGGIQSFALVWLLIIPAEAALAKRKWVISYSLVPLSVALAFLFHGTHANWFNTYDVISSTSEFGTVVGPLALILYVAALTFRVQSTYSASQHRLSVNQERYRLLANNTTDLITQHEASGEILFASPAAKTLLGVAPFEICNQGLFDRVHIADRPAYLKLFSDVVARGLPLKAEFRLRTSVLRNGNEEGNLTFHSDSEFSWMEMRCRPIWDSNEVVTGIVATTRDISERRSQQDALEAAHLDLQQLSDAKTRFLANMSHELRTPLNAIIGFSEILQQELFGELKNEKQEEYVNLIHDSGSHLLQIVTDILDMSKIESGTFDIVPESFDVDRLIKSCTGIMSQQADMRGINLVPTIPHDLPEAVADSRACRQILINLISNALKFSDKNDTVTVGVRVEGDKLAYFVRDTGIGMGKADLKRIGQPFFQADSAHDRRYEGTGLGVSVVKGLTELHKGRVEFESELGEGTCVTVFIPLDCEADSNTVEVFTPISKQPDLSDLETLIQAKACKIA
ncbi:MAG: PAS domain-containing sensor histidine kinase [Hyphomicrobiales bacterium]